MKRAIPLASIMVFATIAAAGFARADRHDHIRCYRVEDRSTSNAVVDVTVDTVALGLQAACTVRATARELCVPATADLLAPPRSQDAVQGEDLLGERLCYDVRCPGPKTAGVLIASDRFGEREIVLGRTKRLCIPADSD